MPGWQGFSAAHRRATETLLARPVAAGHNWQCQGRSGGTHSRRQGAGPSGIDLDDYSQTQMGI